VAAVAGQAWLLLTVLLTLWPVTWLDAGTPHGRMMIPQRPVRIFLVRYPIGRGSTATLRNMLPKRYRVRAFRPAAASNSAHVSPAVWRADTRHLL